MKKTYLIREWLTLLEPGVRDLALANLENPRCKHPAYKPDRLADCLREALNYAFTWCKTEQGHDYWSELYHAAGKDNRRPRVFTGIDCTLPE